MFVVVAGVTPDATSMTQWQNESILSPLAIPRPVFYITSVPIKPEILEAFENQYPGRDYVISISCPEFTCVCPRSGQPDFAVIKIDYVPDKKCLELKALKFYIQSFRDVGIFHENAVNRILEDLVKVCSPRKMTVVGDFNPRGNIHTVVTASYPDKF